MESFLSEARHVLWRLLILLLVSPMFAYGILLCIEDLEKAWKTGSRKKKWLALTICLITVGIAFGALQ
ncbi:MAG: hypothetical protein ACRCSV_00595 [Chlamydiales bacterium]